MSPKSAQAVSREPSSNHLNVSHHAEGPALKPEQRTALLGRIVSISGSRAIMHLSKHDSVVEDHQPPRCDMGTFVEIVTPTSKVIGLVAGVSVPVPSEDHPEAEIKIAELELIGELLFSHDCQAWKFRKGVSVYPALDDRVYLANKDDLDNIFSSRDGTLVRLGSVYQDQSIGAHIRADDLLRKHSAVLGTTGCGKSCTVTLLLKSVLDKCPNARVVLLDPHNEYSSTFGDTAEYINHSNLHLPYWLLTFDELVEVVLDEQKRDSGVIEILRDVVRQAKAIYASNSARNRLSESPLITRKVATDSSLSIDTPTPYRVSDVIQILDTEMGRLEISNNMAPYRLLKSQFERLASDPRYSFMFGGYTVNDNMVEILGRIFRIPINNKPISILDVSGVPSEIVNVVVSVISRMAFDLAVWSTQSLPLLLVCEEAHRYVPADRRLGFEPTKRAIARIAKEGRKYGVSLCVVSQRPSELDPTILSQCNTLFAMRMTNETDQDFVRAACSDSGLSMLEFLTTMGNAEAIAVGEGVPFPMRIKLDRLPSDAIPRNKEANLQNSDSSAIADANFLTELVDRWRAQKRVQPS